jgi:hypothetical protein
MNDILETAKFIILYVLLALAIMGILGIVGYWLYCIHWSIAAIYGCFIVLSFVMTVIDD